MKELDSKYAAWFEETELQEILDDCPCSELDTEEASVCKCLFGAIEAYRSRNASQLKSAFDCLLGAACWLYDYVDEVMPGFENRSKLRAYLVDLHALDASAIDSDLLLKLIRIVVWLCRRVPKHEYRIVYDSPRLPVRTTPTPHVI